MPAIDRPILLATRGSALALAQAHLVLAQCRAIFPSLRFEVKIIKTTGDKLQTAPPDAPGMAGTKGLFTKELELALLAGQADLAVHSLKDLPTELPQGLELCAVLPRADVRDVLIYRDQDLVSTSGTAQDSESSSGTRKRGLRPHATLADFPPGAVIGTSSTRRQAQLLAARPDLKTVPIRGNVGTRLQKLADRAELDGLVLAGAGLVRLGFEVDEDGHIRAAVGSSAGQKVPDGLGATWMSVETMVPCVGQGAIGLEARANDPEVASLCARLNDASTMSCVTAERAFLHGMGGGCLSPVAAYAEISGDQLQLSAVSFREETVRRGERVGRPSQAAELGLQLAKELLG